MLYLLSYRGLGLLRRPQNLLYIYTKIRLLSKNIDTVALRGLRKRGQFTYMYVKYWNLKCMNEDDVVLYRCRCPHGPILVLLSPCLAMQRAWCRIFMCKLIYSESHMTTKKGFLGLNTRKFSKTEQFDAGKYIVRVVAITVCECIISSFFTRVKKIS